MYRAYPCEVCWIFFLLAESPLIFTLAQVNHFIWTVTSKRGLEVLKWVNIDALCLRIVLFLLAQCVSLYGVPCCLGKEGMWELHCLEAAGEYCLSTLCWGESCHGWFSSRFSFWQGLMLYLRISVILLAFDINESNIFWSILTEQFFSVFNYENWRCQPAFDIAVAAQRIGSLWASEWAPELCSSPSYYWGCVEQAGRAVVSSITIILTISLFFHPWRNPRRKYRSCGYKHRSRGSEDTISSAFFFFKRTFHLTFILCVQVLCF